MLNRLLRYLAWEHNVCVSLWRRRCSPDGTEYAGWMKKNRLLHSMGEHCSVQTNVVITDPAYVRIGSNVRLSGCTLFGHDGSVNMINRAYGLKLDRVGRIDIRDNVFIGHGAIVLPNVTIGPNAVVAAGAVVTRDVDPFSVYGGVPARRICGIDELVKGMAGQSATYPWSTLIEQRRAEFDPNIEPILVRMRVAHFYGSDGEERDAKPGGGLRPCHRGTGAMPAGCDLDAARTGTRKSMNSRHT